MNKSALQDIQQALNAIRSEIERVDDETKWAALELMLSTSNSVVALAKKDGKTRNKDSHTHCSSSKDKGSQTRTATTDNAKRHRTKRLHTYPSTATVTKSTRQQRKTLKTRQKCMV
jgi:hypothetical protein